MSRSRMKIIGLATLAILGVAIAGYFYYPIGTNKGQVINISSSSLYPALSIDDLSGYSKYILVGRIKSKLGSRLEHRQDGAPFVYTDYEVIVEKELKNSGLNSGETLILSQSGGSAGGYNMTSSDAAKIDLGERVLLFIHQGKDGRNWIIGAEQGKYRLENGKAINREDTKTTSEEELINKIKSKIKCSDLLNSLDLRIRYIKNDKIVMDLFQNPPSNINLGDSY